MKNILNFSVLIIVYISITGCPIPLEDLRCRTFLSKNDFNYYPQKDTFTVGDTLWLQFSIPKSIKNNDFDITFDKDTLECDLSPLITELINDSITQNTISIIGENYELFFIKGTSIPNNSTFYFIMDDESQKYENYFGFILKNAGSFFISSIGYKSEIFQLFIKKVDNLGYDSKSDGEAELYSTFQSTGKGWFQFEVVE